MKQQFSFNDRLVDLQMLLTHPQSKNKVFILVEGDSDLKIYRKLFSDKNTFIYCIQGGVLNLEKALKILSSKYKTIIGIRDADFMHLEGKESIFPVLFLTDAHDIEMMMFMSDEAFRAVIYEFYHEEIHDLVVLRDKFLKSVEFLGYLRWFNEINKLEFNFNGIGIGDFINPENLLLNQARCIENIFSRSPGKQITDKKEVLKGVKSLAKKSHDLTQLCSGHDVTHVVALYFTGKTGKGMNSERIESHLRTAYNQNQFKITKLYESIKSWSDKNGYSICDN